MNLSQEHLPKNFPNITKLNTTKQPNSEKTNNKLELTIDEITNLKNLAEISEFFSSFNLREIKILLSREMNQGPPVNRRYSSFLMKQIPKKSPTTGSKGPNLLHGPKKIREKFIQIKKLLQKNCQEIIKKNLFKTTVNLDELNNLRSETDKKLIYLPEGPIRDIVRNEIDEIINQTKKIYETKSTFSKLPLNLNENRENSFKTQIQEITLGSLQQIKKSFQTVFSITKYWTHDTNEIFNHVKIFTSDIASKITGEKIKRPVFVIKDINILNELQGNYNAEASGMYVPPLNDPKKESVMWQSGIIIALDNDKSINHEILHSIDPYINLRPGINKIIEEIFTYYNDFIINGKENNTNKWESLFKTLTNKTYNKTNLQENINDPILLAEYLKKIKTTINHLKKLREKYNDIDIMRIIGNSQSLEEINQTI